MYVINVPVQKNWLCRFYLGGGGDFFVWPMLWLWYNNQALDSIEVYSGMR
jgi:hypothetical protein